MFKKIAASLAILQLVAAPVTAASQSGQFASYSVGAQNCSVILDAYRTADQGAVLFEVTNWISGYVTALNRLTDGTYDVTPILNHASLTLLTLRVCENNPDKLYESIVSATLDIFKPVRVAENIGTASMKRDDAMLSLREPAVKTLQELLVAQGYLDANAADGVFGNQTSAAISAWQKANDQLDTGLFDPLTILVLLQSQG